MARQSDRNEERGEEFSAKGSQGQEKSGNGGKQKTDAIEMLKADHRRVEQLFEKFETARRRAEKSKLAQQICLELTIHAEIEEEIFYPACREHVDDPMLDEAQIEHDTAKILLAEIAMGTPTADPYFDAKVKVLGEYIRHHIQEEEKNADSIFAQALEGGVDTAALGEKMMARREELMEQFSEELLLPQPRSLHVNLEQEEGVWEQQPARGRGARGGREMEGRGREGGESRGREESRGWQGREERDDERRSARGGREEEGRGWRGDPEGHAEAARRGWDEREGEERRSRGREEERSAGAGRGRSGEQRGWFGDPKRHSEASRRGWEHRR
jgi:hemerythrin superfamily protein